MCSTPPLQTFISAPNGVKKDKYKISSYSITDKFLKNFELKKKENPNDVDNWIDEWYDIFPKGVKSGGGKYARTGKKSCLKKLKMFIKEHPEFTKENIITATNNYIEDREKNNFAYISTAPLFIYKDGASSLEGWCDSLEEYEIEDEFKTTV